MEKKFSRLLLAAIFVVMIILFLVMTFIQQDTGKIISPQKNSIPRAPKEISEEKYIQKEAVKEPPIPAGTPLSY